VNSAQRRRERRLNQERLERQAYLQRKPAQQTKAEALAVYEPPSLSRWPELELKLDTSWASLGTSLSHALKPMWQSFDPLPAIPSVNTGKLAALKDASPYKVQARTPDYVHVLTAWRAWKVSGVSGELRLQALGGSHVWEPKQQINAKCNNSSGYGFTLSVGGALKPITPHLAPAVDCSCGVWALKDLDRLVAAIGSSYGEIRVLGQVSLWGRVVETENGYRAQHAYPSELWLFDNSLEELGAIYDVPVRSIQP